MNFKFVRVNAKPKWEVEFEKEMEKQFMAREDVQEKKARANKLMRDVEELMREVEIAEREFDEQVVKPAREKLRNEKSDEKSDEKSEYTLNEVLDAMFASKNRVFAVKKKDSDDNCDCPACTLRRSLKKDKDQDEQ